MSTYDLIIEKPELFKDYFLNDETESIKYFPKLNSINIIIGANNSGKSRFMRNLMSLKTYLITDSRYYDEYNQLIKDYNKYIIDYYGSQNKQYLLKQTSLGLLKTEFKENKINLSQTRFRENKIYLKKLEGLQTKLFFLDDEFKKYLVPTLRTAHSLFDKNSKSKIETDIFKDTLNQYYNLDYFDVDVFTGLHLYKEILNSRNSKRQIRKLFESFETFIGDNFFGGRKIDVVAEFNKDESLKGNNHSEIISLHVDGEEETRKFYELGDGIQAIIILMYKIFMAEENSFVFIDEPELNLHPGMQRLFLEQITSNKDLKKKNLTYFITTHSNHFLDLTIEKENVSIYSFSSKLTEEGNKKFIINNVNVGDNEILKKLGVNNSSVFIANSSIWVEGISDRNYIKAFLKSYCNSIKQPYPKEDIDFAFFEYAGSNIDHYIFDKDFEKEDAEVVIEDINALALSNRIFLLADSDASTKFNNKSKYERLIALEGVKTKNFIPKIVWSIREIENLLPNDVWKKVLIHFCNDKLLENNSALIETRIEEALNEYDSSKYAKKYIGNFLNDLRASIKKIGNTYILNKSFYETKSDGSFGTITNKRKLSELVLVENIPWEIFSQNKEIEKLTLEIYDFITNK